MITTLFSPAKINRSLYIGKFSEKYQKHKLKSIMQKINLYDVIKIKESSYPEISIQVSGKFQKNVPSDAQKNTQKNVVFKAIKYFYKKYSLPQKFFSVHIKKNIPNQAGLGGGSSNAAEILKFLHNKGNIPLIPSQYVNLGSDIPFFLEKFSSGLLEGVGEKISEYPKCKTKFGAVIIPKNISISTKWAFTEFKNNEKKQEKNENIKNDFTTILCKNYSEITFLLKNISLYNPIEYGISGSGSSLYALFSSKETQKQFLYNWNINNTDIIDIECL